MLQSLLPQKQRIFKVVLFQYKRSNLLKYFRNVVIVLFKQGFKFLLFVKKFLSISLLQRKILKAPYNGQNLHSIILALCHILK